MSEHRQDPKHSSEQNARRILETLKGNGPRWTRGQGLFQILASLTVTDELLDLLATHRADLTPAAKQWLRRWEDVRALAEAEETEVTA